MSTLHLLLHKVALSLEERKSVKKPNDQKRMVVFHLANIMDGQFFRIEQNINFLKEMWNLQILEIRIRFPFPFRGYAQKTKAPQLSSCCVILPLQCPWLGVFTKIWNHICGVLVALFVTVFYRPDIVLSETDFTSHFAHYMKKLNKNILHIADFHLFCPPKK